MYRREGGGLEQSGHTCPDLARRGAETTWSHPNIS